MEGRQVEAKRKIFTVINRFLRECFRMHLLGRDELRDEILDMIDSCVETLFRLNFNPQELENEIIAIGFRYFPGNFNTIEQFVNRILPGLDNYEILSLSESTVASDNES